MNYKMTSDVAAKVERAIIASCLLLESEERLAAPDSIL